MALPLVMTEAEVADVLRVSARTVKRLTKQGLLPRLHDGLDRARYAGAEVERFVARAASRPAALRGTRRVA